jgi:DNA-binding transcriptional LysR family regulator
VDFRQLRYFLAAVEQRSMSGAARACAAAQPTLSTQIRRLELELGEALFVRTPSGLQPTRAGRALYRAATPVLHSAAHAFRYLSAGSHQPIAVATVKIDYSIGSRLGVLARTAVHAVETRHPHFKLVLEGSESGPAEASPGRAHCTAAHFHLRHVLNARASGVVPGLADAWLLVEAGSGRGGLPPSRRLAGGVLSVPALPDDVAETLIRRPDVLASTALYMHGEEATDLLRLLVSQNHGIALLPRLTMPFLQHPRLRIEEIARGLPRLMVAIEGTSAHPGMRAAFAREMARLAKAGTDVVDRDLAPARLPDARQLQYFLGGFAEGGLTRTAAKFNIVQPALSAQMKSLEGKLGAKLFERSARGIAPTEFGRVAHELYAPIIEQLNALRRRQPLRPSRPIFRVGLLPALDEQSLLVEAVTAAILEWQQAFPNITLKSTEALSDTLLDWVADGTVDLAMVDDLHARSSFVSRSLCSEPLVILTSAQNATCPNGPIKLADVARLDLVLPSSRHGLRALMNRHFESIGLTLTPKLELDSMASAVRLTKSGGWATILPASAVRRSIEAGVLAAHPIVQPAVMRILRAVELPRRTAKAWENRFVAILRTHLRRAPKNEAM